MKYMVDSYSAGGYKSEKDPQMYQASLNFILTPFNYLILQSIWNWAWGRSKNFKAD